MATIKTLSSNQLITAEQALENLLHSIRDERVRGELEKWWAFGRTGEAGSLSRLNQEQLGLFMDKIKDLTLVLYCYQQEVQKGGDHES